MTLVSLLRGGARPRAGDAHATSKPRARERLLHTENRVRGAVRKGVTPLAAYRLFGVFWREGRWP